MTRYNPRRPGHTILAHLEAGPAPAAELRRVAAPNATDKKRKRVWRVIFALQDDGFITRDEARFYHLTRSGADALSCLRGGHEVVVGAETMRRAA